ncbi:MAG: acyl-CoA/acyl-ACP dehydrogenase [Chloroflexi bacterium]|nr:acyl-CoA/acyl-ACP dehydrogenase [Chloroflexota bacterium]
MDMELTETQRHLKDTARRLMEKECPPGFVREMEQSELGYSPELWKQMAEVGWLALPLPEEYDGIGLGTVDLAILTKELGRALCPSPYLPTVVLAGGAIVAAGSEAQKRTHLANIIAGDTVIAFAMQESTQYYDARGVSTRATAEGDGFVLNGTKMFVEFAEAADLLLVVARSEGEPPSSDGLSMFLIDPKSPGVKMTHLPTMARDKQYEVVLDNVQVSGDDLLGPAGGAWPLLEEVVQRGTIAFASYAVGAAEKMQEMSTDFAKDRVQFGRPIGSFQVIQGYLAQLIIEIWGAETLTYYTAWAMDEGMPVRGLVAKTKAFAGDTIKHTTDVGSQIFGGIGYMEDMDNTLYLRRGKQYQLAMGDGGYWEDVIAEEILDK